MCVCVCVCVQLIFFVYAIYIFHKKNKKLAIKWPTYVLVAYSHLLPEMFIYGLEFVSQGG